MCAALKTVSALAIIATLASAVVPAVAQMPDFEAVEIKTTDLGGGVYILEGMGGNIGLSVGEDGVFVIDDQFAPLAPKILAAIANITDQPVDFLVNTHWHFDHAGGNVQMAEAGALIFAHDNARVRMAAPGDRQVPEAGLPVVTFSDSTTFHFNGQEILVFHPEPAHTDGDAVVFFKGQNIIHGGDLLFTNRFPFIDISSGGSVDGYITALEKLLEISDTETRFISGHGPMATRESIQASIDMITDSRDIIRAMKKTGKLIEDIKAANPLAKYDDWSWGFIDTARFTELMYGGI